MSETEESESKFIGRIYKKIAVKKGVSVKNTFFLNIPTNRVNFLLEKARFFGS